MPEPTPPSPAHHRGFTVILGLEGSGAAPQREDLPTLRIFSRVRREGSAPVAAALPQPGRTSPVPPMPVWVRAA